MFRQPGQGRFMSGFPYCCQHLITKVRFDAKVKAHWCFVFRQHRPNRPTVLCFADISRCSPLIEKALARSNINQIFDNMVKLLHASLIFGVGVVRVAFKERLSKELSARVCLFRLLLLSSPWLQDLHWEEKFTLRRRKVEAFYVPAPPLPRSSNCFLFLVGSNNQQRRKKSVAR